MYTVYMYFKNKCFPLNGFVFSVQMVGNQIGHPARIQMGKYAPSIGIIP